MASAILVGPETVARPTAGGGRDGFDDLGPGGDGGRGEGPAPRYDKYQTGIWIVLIPVVMLFVGLTSSLVVRRGMSDDWSPIQLPSILWLNALVLVASSVTFERVKKGIVTSPSRGFHVWLYLTAGLGTCFLLGQLAAWRRLADQGVFLASNPSSSFFYVLTATHGAHLLGGMSALIYLTVRVLRNELNAARRSALRAAALYWHFMDALWIYLLFLLIFWR